MTSPLETALRMVCGFATPIVLSVLVAVAAGAQPLRIGFEIVRTEDDPTVGRDTVVWRYKGPIEHPMATNLHDLVRDLPPHIRRVALELDSQGGEVRHIDLVVEALRPLRDGRELHTAVQNGSNCLSACIPVFMQGIRRAAGGASIWLFHGACSRYTNVPAPAATAHYVEMLLRAGVSKDFLCRLDDIGVFKQPGAFWISGHELYLSAAGIITDLLPSWQPQKPVHLPFDPNLRAR